MEDLLRFIEFFPATHIDGFTFTQIKNFDLLGKNPVLTMFYNHDNTVVGSFSNLHDLQFQTLPRLDYIGYTRVNIAMIKRKLPLEVTQKFLVQCYIDGFKLGNYSQTFPIFSQLWIRGNELHEWYNLPSYNSLNSFKADDIKVEEPDSDDLYNLWNGTYPESKALPEIFIASENQAYESERLVPFLVQCQDQVIFEKLVNDHLGGGRAEGGDFYYLVQYLGYYGNLNSLKVITDLVPDFTKISELELNKLLSDDKYSIMIDQMYDVLSIVYYDAAVGNNVNIIKYIESKYPKFMTLYIDEDFPHFQGQFIRTQALVNACVYGSNQVIRYLNSILNLDVLLDQVFKYTTGEASTSFNLYGYKDIQDLADIIDEALRELEPIKKILTKHLIPDIVGSIMKYL